MKIKLYFSLLGLLCFIQISLACSKETNEYINQIDVGIPTESEPHDSTYIIDSDSKTDSVQIDVDTIIQNPNNTNTTPLDSTTNIVEQKYIKFKTKIIGNNIIKGNSFSYNNMNFSGQGMAIYNNYMFRLYHSGYCSIYDLSDINNIRYVNSFALGSYSSLNHANCAQFANDTTETGFPLLYVSYNHTANKCAVEKVSLYGSELIKYYFGFGHIPNVILGEDNNLWGIGSNSSSSDNYHLIFWKHPLPIEGYLDYNENSITATDIFTDISDDIPKTWQGGKVKNGKIYFLFGTPSINRQIRVYDTSNHNRIAIIDLNQVTSAEPEDIDIWQDNKIIMTLNGVNYAILIEFEDNPYIP